MRDTATRSKHDPLHKCSNRNLSHITERARRAMQAFEEEGRRICSEGPEMSGEAELPKAGELDAAKTKRILVLRPSRAEKKCMGAL